MAFKLADKQKISAAIAISCAFFICELAGWWQHPPSKRQSRQLTVSQWLSRRAVWLSWPMPSTMSVQDSRISTQLTRAYLLTEKPKCQLNDLIGFVVTLLSIIVSLLIHGNVRDFN
jgi:hypothetical protein